MLQNHITPQLNVIKKQCRAVTKQCLPTTRCYLSKRRLRFSTTKVGKSPCCIPKHWKFSIFSQLCKQRNHCTTAENQVSTSWTITSHIAQGPYRLQLELCYWISLLHYREKYVFDLRQINDQVTKQTTNEILIIYIYTQWEIGKTSTSTCSRTSSLGELRSCTNIGTAPLSITTLVWSDVPEAILVRAQAASN